MPKPETEAPMYLRIGQVAARSGVSAKALRLYEKRGLLRPASYSAAGYRLYDGASLARLMQVVLLRRSGFALAEIRVLLGRDPQSGAQVLATRIAALEREVAVKTRSLNALRMAAGRLDSAGPIDVDELTGYIRMSTNLDVKLTEAERAAMRRRADALGEEGMAQAQRAWTELIADVRAAMDAGTRPAEPAVQALARRWSELAQTATGGDPELGRKIAAAYREQPEAMAAQGMDAAMFRYIGEAMEAAGLKFSR